MVQNPRYPIVRSSLMALAITCSLVSPTMSQDRVRESIEQVKHQTQVIRQLVEYQRRCLGLLETVTDWIEPCRSAKTMFVEEIFKEGMGLYLDTIGEYAQLHQDHRILEVGNDYFFYHRQAKELDDGINLVITIEQLDKIMGY